MAVELKTDFVLRNGSLDDVPAVTELTNIAMEADTGSGHLTEQELSEQWQQAEFDPTQDTLLVHDQDGTLIGATEFWFFTPYNRPFIWGAVHPDYRGQGVGTQMLDWAEERGKAVMHRAPADARFLLRAFSWKQNQSSIDLLKGSGFECVRQFYDMRIDFEPGVELPEPAWAEGIRVRTHVAGQDDRAVFEAVEDAFRDHWGFSPGRFETFRQGMIDVAHFDPSLWFLAVEDTPDGEQIAGLSLCRVGTSLDPDQGYVMELGVRRQWRRRGIALALLHHTFREFQARGLPRVGLGVDASSLTGATRLYEKAGMHVERSSESYEKELRSGRILATQTLDD